ncbi:TIR domain-containing protein [Archangium sp.]|uniref:TIR domain-containing protein n=1 Tax=Archangium sp. TaxID=1872627 RepID=UPI002D259F60|nr:TIR domain-containing protein [Archangium sp.]HYO59998.1 TIR domain-containing protein [Archangium sp.]
MPKVFLSHIRADRAQARRLAEFLRYEGHTPWLAEDEARVGEPLAETLARGLRDTQLAVVLISRASVESAWTSTEVALLRDHARQPLRSYVARLDRVTPPAEVAEERAVDLFPGETAWHSGTRRLLQLLAEGHFADSSAGPSDLPPNNLPPRTVPFIGRELELATLHERLMAGNEAGRAVLRGPRGMGKTTFAVEYATRYAADYPGGIWWIPAWLGPKRALTWLCMSLYFHHRDAASVWKPLEQHPLSASSIDVARHVSQVLQSHPKPTLLILDDLKSDTWQHYLMTGQTRVLVTSRIASPTGFKSAFVQHLSPLPQRNAEELLEVALSLKDEPSQQAARDRILNEWLRGNPLLVTLVARFIARTRMPWDVLEQELVQRASRASGGQSLAGRAAREAAVLDLGIEQFPPDSLPRQILEGASIFMHGLELGSPLAWAAATGESPVFEEMPGDSVVALQTLDRSGLLLYTDPFCQVHGAISQRVKALAMSDTWARIIGQGLAATLDWIQEQEHYDAYEPWVTEGDIIHLEAALRAAEPRNGSDVWVEAASFLAGRFSRRGEHLSAKVLRKRALHHVEQGMGYDVEFINDLRAKLAATHEALGKRSTAQRLLKQAVADDASNHQGRAERKVQRLADLALLRFRGRQPTVALESIERALEIDRGALAGRHPEFPVRLFLRARILRDLGRGEEAHVLLEEALATGERLAEKEFLSLTPIREALAESRRERGDEKGALALLERVVDDDRRVLGRANHETVLHLTELARTYAAFERRPQTRTSVERVLPLLDEALALADPRRGDILSRLAEALLQVGEHGEAHPLLVRALDVEAAQPTLDVNRLRRLVLLCLFYADKEDARADLLERVLSLVRRAAPGNHEGAGRLSRLLAHVLHPPGPVVSPTPATPLHMPSPGAGAESLERALRLLRRSKVRDEVKAEALHEALAAAQQGNDSANGARAHLLLADLEGRRGAWEQARASARQGLQLALRAEVPSLVAEGYRLLGDAALHGSFYEEARMSYEEAIRRYDGLKEHRRAAQTRALLVTLLLQLGRFDGIEAHVRWFEAHQQHPALTEEDRSDLREVLALAGRRLSSPARGARHPRS